MAGTIQVCGPGQPATTVARAAAADETEAKTRRARTLDRATRDFEAEVSGLTRALTAAAAEMEATARGMSASAAVTLPIR